MRLENKITLITGGATGSGKACARRFAGEYVTLDQWRKIQKVNVEDVFTCCRAATKIMKNCCGYTCH